MTFILESIYSLLLPLSFFASRIAAWLVVPALIASFFIYKPAFRHQILEDFWPISLYWLWALTTCLWAPQPLASFQSMMSITFMGVAYLHLQHLKNIEKLSQYVAFGFIIASICVLYDNYMGNPWLNFKGYSSAKFLTPLSVLMSFAFWPMLRFAKTWPAKIVLTILSLGVLWHIDCDTSIVALVVGLLAYILCLWNFEFLKKILLLSTVCVALALPWAMHHYFTQENITAFNQKFHLFSYVHRLYVWRDSSRIITEKPYLGYGHDASRTEKVGGVVREHQFIENGGNIQKFLSREIPMHPHNIFLQIWLEHGLIGMLLFLFAFAFQIRRLRAPDQLAFYVTVLSVGMVCLGAWQSWWLGGILLFGALIRHPKNHQTL